MLGKISVMALGGSLLAAQPVLATTGGVCFELTNVPPSDVVNMRSKPNIGARVVARFSSSSVVILSKAGQCGRWCRVSASTEHDTRQGWIHSQFLRAHECPRPSLCQHSLAPL